MFIPERKWEWLSVTFLSIFWCLLLSLKTECWFSSSAVHRMETAESPGGVLHDPRWCHSHGTHVLVVCVGTPIILLLIPYPTLREMVHYILFYFMFQQKISDVQGHPQLCRKYEANPRYIRISPKQKYHMIIHDISNNIKVEKPSAQW